MADGLQMLHADDQHARRRSAHAGLAAGLGAYLIWGFVAIYFKFLMDRGVTPGLMLAYRITWSFAFLLVMVTALRLWPEVVACARSGRAVRALAISTVLIAVNWYTYIYAIDVRQLSQASLGYYMNPLVNVLLGVLVLRERLRAMQVVAVVIAAVAVAYLTLAQQQLPWIALSLAVSFGLYGLMRKTMPAGAMVGLMVETALCTPLTLGYIIYCHTAGAGVAAAAGYPLSIHGWLALSGIITATPLLLFAASARRLRLSSVGFLQYLSPTIQLLVAVLLFGEPFTRQRAITFALIWAAIAFFVVDQIRAGRANRSMEPVEA
jgi:chloramphenicol-sensitive protein RarD